MTTRSLDALGVTESIEHGRVRWTVPIEGESPVTCSWEGFARGVYAHPSRATVYAIAGLTYDLDRARAAVADYAEAVADDPRLAEPEPERDEQ